MNDPRDELTDEQQRFVARVAGAYQAPPRSPGQSAAFQRAIEARVARRRVERWLPALAGALAAAAIAWLAIGVGREPTPGEEAQIASAEEAILALSADEESDEEALPEEYLAIASVFLGN
jgi:ferric-dicitrate binding protein FerR (iron transport regulator)